MKGQIVRYSPGHYWIRNVHDGNIRFVSKIHSRKWVVNFWIPSSVFPREHWDVFYSSFSKAKDRALHSTINVRDENISREDY